MKTSISEHEMKTLLKKQAPENTPAFDEMWASANKTAKKRRLYRAVSWAASIVIGVSLASWYVFNPGPVEDEFDLYAWQAPTDIWFEEAETQLVAADFEFEYTTESLIYTTTEDEL